MKKILLALLTLMSVISYSQTTGHLRYDTVRVYKQNGNSNLVIENATRDTLGFLYNYGNGRTRFEKVRAVPGGIKFGEDTIVISGTQADFLIGGSVTPEGGFRFSVQEATYGIEGVIYLSDSATVFVDSSDDTYDRFDAIYLDSDQTVKVLTGIPAENPAIPQLPSGTILLTVVSVEAGAIQANVTSINVYFENDATITPSGTTAVGNSTAAPYAGTYHIRITTNNNGDFVDIIKTSGTWDISGQDFLSFHIKNRATIPQLANWRASLWNGASTGSQVSGEVILNYNKSNSTTYQAISIPMSAFQTITNTNIDRIRLRYTSNNATNHAGIDLDNIFFGDNLQQPGGGDVNSVDVSIDGTALSVSGPSTGAVNKAFTWEGNSTQYIRGDGTLATFSAVTTVGAFGSQASQANGLFISGLNIYGQPVTATEPGMATSAMMTRWDSSYYVTHIGNGIEYMVPVDAATTAFKTFVVTGSGFTTINTDTTFGLNITGGGSGARFGFSGEDDTQAEDRTFVTSQDLFRIRGEAEMVFASSNPGADSVFFSMYNQEIQLYSADDIGFASSSLYMNLSEISFDQSAGVYKFDALPDSIAGTNYMMVWDGATDQVHKAPLPTVGGGSGTVNSGAANRLAYYPASATTVDDLAAITANSLLASDANGLPVAVTGVSDAEAAYLGNVTSDIQTQINSKVSSNIYTADGTLAGDRIVDLDGRILQFMHNSEWFLRLNSTTDDEDATLRSFNITGGENIAQIVNSTSNFEAQFHLTAEFNASEQVQIVGHAESGQATLTYEAANGHTFTGGVILPSLAAGASTDSIVIWNATTNLIGYKDIDSLLPELVLSATYFDGAGTTGDPIVTLIDATPTDASVVPTTSNAVFDGLATKQATLVSGTNIKTINGTTILGSGDLVVSAGADAWLTAGNTDANATTKFIGYTVADSLVFKIQNTFSGMISAASTSLGLGSGTGPDFTGFGERAGESNGAGGQGNTVAGAFAGYLNVSGDDIAAFGAYSLRNNTASFNTGVGSSSLFNNTTGVNNVAVGFQAGYNSGVSLTNNTESVFIGADANSSVNGVDNGIAIGYAAQVTADNQVVIGNTSITQTILRGNVTAPTLNKVTVTAPATASTLTIADGKTLTASNTLTLTATDGSTLAIGTGGTLGTNAYTSTAFAPLASPTFTGVPAAPTAAVGTNTTQLATTAFVMANNSYALPVTAVSGTVVDGNTYYFGMIAGRTLTANTRNILVRKNGTIKIADVYMQATTAGSAEDISMYIRLNNTTDYLIQTVGVSSANRVWTNSSLSIAVVPGDFFEIKMVCPTFATDPAGATMAGYVYIE